MTDRSAAAEQGRPSPSRTRQTVLASALTLLAGFLLVQVPAVDRLFGILAEFLAICSAAVLRTVGYPVMRTGIEIRDQVSGHAVTVTSACDGAGLMVGVAGAVVWLELVRSRLPRPVGAAVLAFGLISLFNLIRILALFLSIPTPGLMRAQHLYAAPLLSALLVAVLALHARGMRPGDLIRMPLAWLACAAAAALVWYVPAERASCLAVVPLANVLLWAMPGNLTQNIVCSTAQGTVATSALLPGQDAATATAAFYPSDFTLALPLVVASLALRQSYAATARGAVLSILLFAAAMAVAAVSAGIDAAAGTGAGPLSFDGVLQTYHPPGILALALLKAGQNAIVHFNLFVLPLALAGPDWTATRPPPSPRPATGTRRRSRR